MFLRNSISVFIIFAATISFANQWHEEADRCWNEAQKNKKERNYKQAIEYLKRAVAAERKNEIPRSDELISQLNAMGQVYDILGNYNKSLHYYKMMLKTCQKHNNADQEAMALNNIGQTYFNLNRFDEAMNSYRQALDISQKNGHMDKMVLVLNNLALVHRVMKDFNSARECYEKALAYAKDAGSTVNMAVVTSNAGTMYYFMGDFDRSLELYSQALEINRRRGGDEYLSIDMSNIGSVYAAKGRYGEALNYYEKALEIDSRFKNEKNMSARMYRLGDIYSRVGDNNRAIEFYNKSLKINLGLNNTINAALIQNSIGQVFDSMGKYEDALDYYLKALALNKDIELQENIALRMSDIGLLYETRERHGEAVDYISKALLRDMMADKRNKIADNLSNIGRVMVSMKRFDKALDYFKEAMGIYRELGDIISLADDSKNCGIVYYNMNEYARAIEYFVHAMQTLDASKQKNNLSLLDVRSDVYRWLTASYIKADKPDKAYETNEAFCINKIYTLVSETPPVKEIQSISFDKLKRKLKKNSALIIFTNILWDNPFLIYIDAESAAGFELDKTATVNAVYNVLGKDIESFIGQKKADIIFKISQKSRRDYYYIEFEKIINYYRSLLSKKYISGREYEIQQTISKILYQFMFQKIEKNIAGKDSLIIQPDGVLTTVPYETMVMPDGRFLVEKFGIQYTFSRTCDDIYSDREYSTARKSMLIMGAINSPPRPTLKNIESPRHFELIADGINRKILGNKGILEMYGFFGIDDLTALPSSPAEITMLKTACNDAEMITGEQATESAIEKMSRTGSLGNYRVLHIISRGIIVPEVPQLSALMVSFKQNEGAGKDGLLNARKLASLNLRADLVHMGVVSIPVAGYNRGEGIWHLCSSFMIAGSQGVSLSLWNVDEAARSYFMKQVYKAAISQSLPFEKAFSQTKRAFIQGKVDRGGSISGSSESDAAWNYSNPYFWGSFIYYGR